ncbi:MAG: GDP-mannose 4,6-dehydratase [Thermoanaerobaculia bacterium]|nr:GDP-mannose 4,6-dehydratase [Thermoanaerobaculia bacterium]
MSDARSFLLTGGAGFVGSHLSRTLLEAGHNVTVIDDLSTGRFENIAPLQEYGRFHFAIDTITNEAVVDRMVSAADVVIHLAAAVGVKLIVERPVRTIETNVIGTELVMRTALRYRVKVLLASTSEVYGKLDKVPFAEGDDVVLGPTTHSRWAYAASKMLDEFLGLAYHREYGLPVVVARLFNTVGPRQRGRYGMVLPRFVGQALAGEPLTVFGDGLQRRCFCDVRDVVHALAGLAIHPEAVGQVYNIGGNDEISIEQLAETVIERLGSASGIVKIPYEEAYGPGFEDMRRRRPDCTKIADLLGWRPAIRLAETIDAVAEEMAVRTHGRG